MKGKKVLIKNIENTILFSIPLSFIISVFCLPIGKIISNGYIKYGFFNTILFDIFKCFFPVLPLVLLFIFILRLLIPAFRPERLKPLKILFVISTVAIGLLFVLHLYKRFEKSPNLVFIVVDTLRDDHTSFESPGMKTTENLKNILLRDGIYFKNSHSNAPWTLPSISSMMTSRYPSEIGVRNLVSKLGDKEFTLAEIMKEEGYKTCSVISHILLKKVYGLSQGYDIYNEKNISDKFGNHYSISSPGVTEDAIKFIKENRKNKFFLFLHYFDPHYIYIDHEKRSGYKGLFTSKDISFLRKQVRIKNYSKKDLDYLRYCYDTEIRFTDNYIGKFLKELKRLDIFKNTLIVFTSDHGEEFVERGWLGHSTTLNCEQTNVPLIIKPPAGYVRGLRNIGDINVSNIDIIPTILPFLHIERYPFFSGKDILLPDKDRYIFAEVSQKEFGSDIQLISVVWKNWKLIKDLNHRKFFLFNIHNDKHERENLYGSFPGIESRLKFKLVKWEKTYRRRKKTVKRKKPLSREEREKLKTLGYIN